MKMEKAKKGIRKKDAETERLSRIAGVFCKAFEKAALPEPTEENVRIWAGCTLFAGRPMTRPCPALYSARTSNDTSETETGVIPFFNRKWNENPPLLEKESPAAVGGNTTAASSGDDAGIAQRYFLCACRRYPCP